MKRPARSRKVKIDDLSIESILPAPPIRAKLLSDAIAITTGSRNDAYGDPLTHFQATCALKKAFWQAHGTTKQNTPWGHGIDMLLDNLGRISSAPSDESCLAEDRYKDGINYLAIAFEVAKRS